MGKLVEEVRLWHTPAVGAFLLWKFTLGYCSKHEHGDGPVALLHFIAAAVLTSPPLIEPISNQRKNLESYVRSFEEKGQSDLLIGIHERTRSRRAYTLSSIDLAVANGLLVWDTEQGKLYPRKTVKKASRGCSLRAGMLRNGHKADILGGWFASHDVGMVASYMGVRF